VRRETSRVGTALASSSLALAVVVRRVARRQTTTADQQWAARVGTGQAWADRLSYLALPRNVFIEAVALAVFAPLDRRERASILAAPLLAAIVGHALKLSVPRDRPGQARFSPQGEESFPSTHAALATALALAAARVGRQHGLGPWIQAGSVAVAGAVGLARLRASAHWPSDVMAGWLLGIASAQAARLLTAI
jgi:membrane-associated phospholipid phosphatase